jgi:hypothetical protein
MAVKTRSELNADNAALFVNNTTGNITPALEKAFNENVNDSSVNRNGDTFEAGAEFVFDNGSKLREGAIDHGFGGGIAKVCANDKTDQWEDGFRYLIQTSGSTTVIYVENMNGTNPGDNDDETLSYAVGSRWKNLVSGVEYICTQANEGDAIWVPLSGNVTLTNVGSLELDDPIARYQWNGNICTFSITGLVTIPDISTGGPYLGLQFPFDFMNDFVSSTDAILTVNVAVSFANIDNVKYVGFAQTSSKEVRVDFTVDASFVAETVPISITGQFINNPA